MLPTKQSFPRNVCLRIRLKLIQYMFGPIIQQDRISQPIGASVEKRTYRCAAIMGIMGMGQDNGCAIVLYYNTLYISFEQFCFLRRTLTTTAIFFILFQIYRCVSDLDLR